MKIFYRNLVKECQAEHMRLLCYGWPLALLALLTGSVLTTIVAIIALVLAYVGAPDEMEISYESSGEAGQDGQQPLPGAGT